MAELTLQHITKVYHNQFLAIHDFNLHIHDKEFIVIVGPSGCGKSTILRMIAGLESITSGELIFDGQCINEIQSKNRNFAMVFQNYAIYPHMNVYQNIAFGLKMRKVQKSELDQRVREVATILGLEEYLNTMPSELSGGQRQRVALGRAMVRNAKVFLMDEPLSNLDTLLRGQMRREIINLHKRLQTIFIYVTHDQTEAMTMGDRIVVMKDGEILQVGKPEQVYQSPNNMFVGGFIGSPGMNFIRGTFEDNTFFVGDVSVKIPKERADLLCEVGYNYNQVVMGIRSEDFHLQDDENKQNNDACLNVTVDATELLGAETLVYSKLDTQPIIIKLNSDISLQEGQEMNIALNTQKLHFFDPKTENRIRSRGS